MTLLSRPKTQSIPLFSVTERNLKQECVLQEDINSSQGAEGETPSHEVEAHSAMKAPQVENCITI